MEDANLTVVEGAAAAANHLISGQPCTLLSIWFDQPGSDPTVFPAVYELVDEAATADITSSSKVLWRITMADPAGFMNLATGITLALKAGKGICLKYPADGTNSSLAGIGWR